MIGAMTTAPRPAQAAVDRRRCAGLWLSGSPSGLTGIATLRSSSFRHSRRGADFDVPDTLHVRQSKAARRGMPPYLMTELRCSSSLRLTALPTSGWAPIPAQPGQRERYDCEYRRNGPVNLSVFLDAHRPWRKVKVTDRRTNQDFAVCMRELVDVHYPDAPLIRVVLDNLSIHSAGALYDAFPAPAARRVLNRLEFHHTPKHPSWLNLVEIAIGVLLRQSLNRPIADNPPPVSTLPSP